MMKDVWISISNRQQDGGKEENTMVFDTAGYYFFDDGVGVLSYQESELTGLEGTRTSVMVMPDQVVVDRDGILTGRRLVFFSNGKAGGVRIGFLPAGRGHDIDNGSDQKEENDNQEGYFEFHVVVHFFRFSFSEGICCRVS